MMKMALVAGLYTLQKNLLYLAISNLGGWVRCWSSLLEYILFAWILFYWNISLVPDFFSTGVYSCCM
jgi:hypothetical protein